MDYRIDPISHAITDRARRAVESKTPFFVMVHYEQEADKAVFLNVLGEELTDSGLFIREFDPVNNPKHGTSELYPLLAEASKESAICLISGLPRFPGETRPDPDFLRYLNIYRDRIIRDCIRMVLFVNIQDAETFLFAAGDLWDFRQTTYWLESQRP